MELHAYNIGTQSVNELSIYDTDLLNGNDPFISSTFSVVGSYSNVSSIQNWYDYGAGIKLRHRDIRKECEELYLGSTWSAFTFDEKKILSEFFIIPKSMRDEVHTDEEQNENDHYVLYHHLSDDVVERLGSNFDHSICPKSIDYKKDVDMRFHPKYTFDEHGWLTECEYFENLNVTKDSFSFSVFNFSDPVLKYEADYTTGNDGYVQSRTVTRSWYLASGTYSTDTKTSFKIYEPLTARDEGRRRRKNLINKLLIDTVGLIIITSGDLDNVYDAEADAVPLMKEVADGISEYYEYGTKEDNLGNPCKLITQITGSTFSRLDNWVPGTGDTVSIRMFILGRLDP
ncbi:MAG: hypothetical protein SLAVMIC_00913 [uncultured marine phage]|uniref:Uncharacterized protein n=1 Tax=uncultured marine phage TaxID=707152 RepID=A0A8D9FQM4_9VIRU|nr:MAG: hypothetical protein SLAVMIC_00913 [uncultured marine phage]